MNAKKDDGRVRLPKQLTVSRDPHPRLAGLVGFRLRSEDDPELIVAEIFTSPRRMLVDEVSAVELARRYNAHDGLVAALTKLRLEAKRFRDNIIGQQFLAGAIEDAEEQLEIARPIIGVTSTCIHNRVNGTKHGRCSDCRYEREQALERICKEQGLEHSTSCYEEHVGNQERETFWVCRPGCPTLRAKKILDGVADSESNTALR